MPPDTEKLNRIIAEQTRKAIRGYMRSSAFTDRKITDTPTESLSVVNRRYVTLNGVVADRPTSSVATIGQHYFATDTNIPMVYDGTDWRDGVGSVVVAG